MNQPDLFNPLPEKQFEFKGSNYVAKFDHRRLSGQIIKIQNLMADSVFRTLREIEEATGVPQASASALLRASKKECNGAYTLEKRHRGDRTDGLWEYQLILPE